MADEEKPRDRENEPAKKSSQDDDVVGKAYDGRLMRRLLTYLRPYKLQTALSAVAIIFKAGTDVLGPYLVMVPVATYMRNTPTEPLSRIDPHLRSRPLPPITERAMFFISPLLAPFVHAFLHTSHF